MTPFAIVAPPRILFGRGQAGQAGAALAALGSRAFVVHGRDASRVAPVMDSVQASGLAILGHACPREPTLAMLEAALGAARDFGADCVLGLGGGAAMDLAKAVAALAPGGEPMDHLEVVGRGLPLRHAPLPFVAMPTTSGTGSEVTKNAVIDVTEARRKVSLRDDRMVARVAIVDPALTDGCPRGVTLASGLDALTQVIEPYVSTRANPWTDALCRDAIPLAIAALQTLMTHEDADARDAIAWASLCGGLALANAGLGAVHGLAGPAGGLSGAAHGAICGALLPHVLRANSAAVPAGSVAAARLSEVAAWLAEGFGAPDGIAALEGFARGSGLPGLAAMGITADMHPELAEAAQVGSSMKANPAPLSAAELLAVLAAAS